MKLSPLNLLGARARLIYGWGDTPEGKPNGKPRVKEVVMYRCTVCEEIHEWEDDAEDCCKETHADKASGATCPVCGIDYETFRNAADCCLWKDIDAHTRWKIADAVEAGGEWADELGMRPNVEIST